MYGPIFFCITKLDQIHFRCISDSKHLNHPHAHLFYFFIFYLIFFVFLIFYLFVFSSFTFSRARNLRYCKNFNNFIYSFLISFFPLILYFTILNLILIFIAYLLIFFTLNFLLIISFFLTKIFFIASLSFSFKI